MTRLVLVGGSNGSSNLGDRSMFEAVLTHIRRDFPQAQVTTDGSRDWVPPPGVRRLDFIDQAYRRWPGVPRSRAEAALRLVINRGTLRMGIQRSTVYPPVDALSSAWNMEILGSRALVFSGAGGMTDTHAVHGVVGWSHLTSLATHHQVPTFFLGQGVGPLVDARLRSVTSRMLKEARLVNVRDVESAEIVAELTGRDDVMVTADWALLTEPNPETISAVSSWMGSFLNGEPYRVASLHVPPKGEPEYRREMLKAAKRFVKEVAARGEHVVFLPNMTAKGADDRLVFQAVLQNTDLETAKNLHLLPPQFWSPEGAIATIAGARQLLCTRYHPSVFAAWSGTPVVGLAANEYYRQKLVGSRRWVEPTPVVGLVKDLDHVSLVRDASLQERLEVRRELRMRRAELMVVWESLVRAL